MSKGVIKLIEEASEKFKVSKNDHEKEVALNLFSHNLLKICNVNNKYYQSVLLDVLESCNSNIFIINRILFQYLDCIFRGSSKLSIGECAQLILSELNKLESYKDKPAYIMYQGAFHNLRGDRESAFFYMRKSAIVAEKYYGVPRMYLGANSISESFNDWVGSDKRLPAIFPTIPTRNIEVGIPSSEGLVFLSADSKYFNSFKDYIISNLDDLNTKLPLHFHVVDWDNTCSDIEKNIKKNDHLFEIGISSEEYRYLRDKTYFATARFYRAIDIMAIYDSPIYISDIDNKFIIKPESFFKAVNGYDVGLRFNQNGHWFPWWGPSAGSFFVSNSYYGKLFLKHLKEYVSFRFKVNKPRFTWWFDQLALNEVYEYCRQEYPDMKFVNLSEPKYFLSIVRPNSELGGLK